MKYMPSNPPAQCFMRQSTWYRGAGDTVVRGVLWHSTGANNPTLKRYVQPDDNAPDRARLLEILGVNQNKNDWNHISRQAGVHAWIGKLASGEVAAIQVGEWTKKAWGCGSGKKGSCNNGWIQFEICEDALTDRAYFETVYQEAVELTAYLCTLYKLDPQGSVLYNGVKTPVILCHQDSYRLGLGGNHADVYHWFGRFGKTMDDVRADVARCMKGDDEMLTYEQWKEYMERYRKELWDKPGVTTGTMGRELQEAIDQGITAGDGPMALITRQEAVSMIVRAAK